MIITVSLYKCQSLKSLLDSSPMLEELYTPNLALANGLFISKPGRLQAHSFSFLPLQNSYNYLLLKSGIFISKMSEPILMNSKFEHLSFFCSLSNNLHLVLFQQISYNCNNTFLYFLAERKAGVLARRVWCARACAHEPQLDKHLNCLNLKQHSGRASAGHESSVRTIFWITFPPNATRLAPTSSLLYYIVRMWYK